MIGFDSSMDYAWIYRSILESVALTLKNNYDNMCNEMNHFAKHIIITGGGSNSDLFMQIFADVFNLPAGATRLTAAPASGRQSTPRWDWVCILLRDSHQKYGPGKRCLYANRENASRYEALNKGIFRELTQYTDVILKKSYQVIHGNLENVDAIQSWSNA
jgi:sugar (pentulose or hexulose) kinase